MRDSQRKGFSSGTLKRSRESGDSRESANRFARIGPSKVSTKPLVRRGFCQVHCQSLNTHGDNHRSKGAGWNRGKLKGRFLQGSFDKCVRIDLPVPLPVPTHPPLPSSPFPYFPQENHPTTHLNPCLFVTVCALFESLLFAINCYCVLLTVLSAIKRY